MSMEPSKATGNGIVATPSVTSTPKPHLTNGYTSLSNDLLFPPGGIPSLRLPVVVVLMPYCFQFMYTLVNIVYVLYLKGQMGKAKRFNKKGNMSNGSSGSSHPKCIQ